MRFSIRQFLLYFTGLSLWFAVIKHGHYTFGGNGAVTNGALFGIAILSAVKLGSRWKIWSIKERSMAAIVLLLSLVGGMYLNNIYYGYGLDHKSELVRYASVMQDKMRDDPRFLAVDVWYDGFGVLKSRGLIVTGTVSDQASLDALHKEIGAIWKKHVNWEVEIVPPKP